MSKKVKNILIFVAIGLALVLVFILVGPKDEEPAIYSSENDILPTTSGVSGANVGLEPERANRILSLLLSARNITLDASVFDDIAFDSLEDSTVDLAQDGTEGRINPFAPINEYEESLVPESGLPESEDSPDQETISVDIEDLENLDNLDVLDDLLGELDEEEEDLDTSGLSDS